MLDARRWCAISYLLPLRLRILPYSLRVNRLIFYYTTTYTTLPQAAVQNSKHDHVRSTVLEPAFLESAFLESAWKRTMDSIHRSYKEVS